MVTNIQSIRNAVPYIPAQMQTPSPYGFAPVGNLPAVPQQMYQPNGMPPAVPGYYGPPSNIAFTQPVMPLQATADSATIVYKPVLRESDPVVQTQQITQLPGGGMLPVSVAVKPAIVEYVPELNREPAQSVQKQHPAKRHKEGPSPVEPGPEKKTAPTDPQATEENGEVPSFIQEWTKPLAEKSKTDKANLSEEDKILDDAFDKLKGIAKTTLAENPEWKEDIMDFAKNPGPTLNRFHRTVYNSRIARSIINIPDRVWKWFFRKDEKVQKQVLDGLKWLRQKPKPAYLDYKFDDDFLYA